MTEPDPSARTTGSHERDPLRRTIGRKEERKLRARREGDRGPWFWLGMMGLVGWSIVVPTLVGVAVGVWLDARWDDPVSWTLTGLVIGLVVGCLTAWYWVTQESRHE